MKLSYKERTNSVKPVVVVSRCLGFEACRYNGQLDGCHLVEKLKDYVEFITVCPEVQIGLETPREAIRLVRENEVAPVKLIQHNTERELSAEMTEFGEKFLMNLPKVDGFMLKSKSPSCGMKEVKIYKSIEKGSSSVKGNGLFGDLVINKFSNLAVEDDGRVKNYNIRQHFLTKLYLMKNFRVIRETMYIEDLVEFHGTNKLLLMSYNQKQLKILGGIIGRHGELSVQQVYAEYEKNLALALNKIPRYTSNINVLTRSMGYFSDKLTHREKEFILDTIEQYRMSKVPFSVPLYIIKANAIRFEERNLMNQSFFEPYPYSLDDVTDSGKGLDK
ncbi:YbgA family protein [Clostridium sp.]|uniref:YbgA family protein n=1 Tax=Clostridium sp. TaxID=1506 RepID=UPI003D6D448E